MQIEVYGCNVDTARHGIFCDRP